MTIELSATVERELRDLAVTQSRDVSELVEEAIRQYLESAAITDLSPAEIGEAQTRLIGELHRQPAHRSTHSADPADGSV